MRHQPFTIILHIALAIILAGAFVTHFAGVQGTLTLREDDGPVARFDKESGPGNGDLPFGVALKKVEIDYYPATTTPMDFRSILSIEGHEIIVAMNRVGEYEGWRFYQSGMSGDSTTLSLSHDPWGIGITYTGYILLGIGMLGFFFQPNTPWRGLLRKYRKILKESGKVAMLLLALFFSSGMVSAASTPDDDAALPVMQRPLAANLGKILVYWNDRVCPLQTMARDVTTILYGSPTFDGFTSEQVLSGWLFYYDRWEREYLGSHPELRSLPPYPASKKEKKMAEQLALLKWMGTGEAFRIYPYTTLDGRMEWLSLTARKPSGMDLEQWTFMQRGMPEIKSLLLKGKNVKANEVISEIIAGQRKYGGPTLPSEMKIEAERVYNGAVRPLWAAIIALITGLSLLITPLLKTARSFSSNILRHLPTLLSWALLAYVGISMGLLWYVGGHVPLSNGPETMMFMGFAALSGACLWNDSTARGGLLIVAAMALFVAVMGGRTPQIGAMMPVLASPLLSIHVMVVMIAYALFLLIAILAALSLMSRDRERRERLSMLCRILLTPAVSLLGAGIFIGAVWANQTWGRYWGWDPKETCALVMWLVYALPLHWGSRRLRIFRRDKALCIYLLLAVLTVAFTYFGANYLLPGLHSYA